MLDGKFTINGYTEVTTGVTYSHLGLTQKTGNLYYFDASTDPSFEGGHLAWAEPLSANEIYIIAVGGGGGGGQGGASGSGGGAGGGALLISDLFNINNSGTKLSSPIDFTVGSGATGSAGAGGITRILYDIIIMNGGNPGGEENFGYGGTVVAPEITGIDVTSAGGYGGTGGSGGSGTVGTSITVGGRTIYFGGGGGSGGDAGNSSENGVVGGAGGGPTSSGGAGGLGSAPGADGVAGGSGKLDNNSTTGAAGGAGGIGSSAGAGGGGGGGGGYGGGGGGGAGGASTVEGGAGYDGAVFLFVVGEPQNTGPGKPGNVVVVESYNSAVVSGNPTNVSGSPFVSATFTMTSVSLDPAFSHVITVDSSANGIDASGNGIDPSGNYQATFTGLEASTEYQAVWFLTNAYDDGLDSSATTFTTLVGPPGLPDSPKIVPSSRSVIISGDQGNASGSPFTGATFRVFSETSGFDETFSLDNPDPPVIDSSGNGIDPSGNYQATFTGLTPSTEYKTTWFLKNAFGNGLVSAEGPFTTLADNTTAPGQPGIPGSSYADISLPRDTSLIFSGDPTTATGAPFTSAIFFLYSDSSGTISVGDDSRITIDASANGIDASGNGIDASGNYQATFSELTPNTPYWFQWLLTNTAGIGAQSVLSETYTLIPAPTVSVTSTSIIASGNATGLNGSPFTSATFLVFDPISGIPIDASGITIDASANGIDASGNGIDTSGNYQATFSELTPDTPYLIFWYLTNGGVDTDPNGISANTLPAASPPTAPSAPPILTNGTPTSLTVSGDPTTSSNSPFTSATFFLYSDAGGTTVVGDASGTTIDASANGIDASGNGIDASGNYQATFSELTPSTPYWTNWLLTNAAGPGAASGLASFTVGVPFQPPQLTIVGSPTYSTITVTGSSIGVNNSGTDITSAKFYLEPDGGIAVYDASGTTTSDGSGNFTHTYAMLSASTDYLLTWSVENNIGESPQSASLSSTTAAICFLRGSKILCMNGQQEEYMAIEDMRVGTPVKTLSGAYVKVQIIGKMNFKNPDNADRGPNRLFKLSPKNYPQLTEDLIITGCHSILVDKLEPKQKTRHLQLMKNLYMTTGKFRLMAFIDEKAEPYQNPGNHEVWHFALENEEEVCNYGVYANGGLLVESASIKIMRERGGLALIE